MIDQLFSPQWRTPRNVQSTTALETVKRSRKQWALLCLSPPSRPFFNVLLDCFLLTLIPWLSSQPMISKWLHSQWSAVRAQTCCLRCAVQRGEAWSIRLRGEVSVNKKETAGFLETEQLHPSTFFIKFVGAGISKRLKNLILLEWFPW